MLAAMAAEIAAADADDSIAVIVLTGAGRAFSSGFDMTGGGSEGDGPADLRARANLENFLAIWRARKPVVAAVDGYALGAGCILASLCDLVLASDRAVFGEPEIRWNPRQHHHPALDRRHPSGQADAVLWHQARCQGGAGLRVWSPKSCQLTAFARQRWRRSGR